MKTETLAGIMQQFHDLGIVDGREVLRQTLDEQGRPDIQFDASKPMADIFKDIERQLLQPGKAISEAMDSLKQSFKDKGIEAEVLVTDGSTDSVLEAVANNLTQSNDPVVRAVMVAAYMLRKKGGEGSDLLEVVVNSDRGRVRAVNIPGGEVKVMARYVAPPEVKDVVPVEARDVKLGDVVLYTDTEHVPALKDAPAIVLSKAESGRLSLRVMHMSGKDYNFRLVSYGTENRTWKLR